MAEAVGYAARRVHVLALKLTAAQELRNEGFHGAAAELDAGEAGPSHRGAGGRGCCSVCGGSPPEGSGEAGAGTVLFALCGPPRPSGCGISRLEGAVVKLRSFWRWDPAVSHKSKHTQGT
jgi:hypothetical protein